MEPTLKAKDNLIEKQDIVFSIKKNKAVIVKASVNDSAENIINNLNLSFKPKSIILIFGGEMERFTSRLPYQ